MVSGFIIPISMERVGSLKAFWVSRLFRLYPLYWASLAGGVLFLIHPIGIKKLSLFIIANATMFQQYMGVPHAIGVYWTLSLEMIFYFLCSVLFASGLLKQTRLLAWSVALLSMVIFSYYLFFHHQSVPSGQLLLLVVAFATSYLHSVFDQHYKLSGFMYFLPVLVLATLFGAWLRFEVYPPDRSTDTAFTFSCVILSWFSAYCVFLALFFFRNRNFPAFFLYLGTISYSLYLVHPFVIHFLPRSIPPLLWVPAVAMGAIACSVITYLLIELPAIKMGRSITGRMRSPARN